MCCVTIYFEWKPEGEEEDGVQDSDDGDRVEVAEAVGKVGREDAANYGAAARKMSAGFMENGIRCEVGSSNRDKTLTSK